MAESSGAAVGGGAASSTVTTENEAQPEPRSLTIKLRKRKPDKKVEWTCDTVDNENLGRRSSKCESPRVPLPSPCPEDAGSCSSVISVP
ncbi:hypothetical protein GDO81_027324 [Engystomops pustulosus]|uniref:E3 ubiquitin-protein ligase PPP1R11 n=1 Tax=Engystomops pustulosus TaxID=76066 RepID=A0AAV6YEP1_ENGPU|nr:hypothetical protein GDO81_027324 [Engystomops pustulosus]